MTITKKTLSSIKRLPHYRIFLTGLLFLLALTVQGQQQSGLKKVVKKYFRVDPFEGRFSSFVRAYKTDPELVNKQISDKTDSSLFFVKGIYTSFNPFDIRPDILSTELSERTIPVGDSIALFDTIVTYQVMAVYDSATTAVKNRIAQEYQHIINKTGRDLKTNTVLNLAGKSNIKEGWVASYFYPASALAAITVSWFTDNTQKTYLLIHIRITHHFNSARFVGEPMQQDFRQFIEDNEF